MVYCDLSSDLLVFGGMESSDEDAWDADGPMIAKESQICKGPSTGCADHLKAHGASKRMKRTAMSEVDAADESTDHPDNANTSGREPNVPGELKKKKTVKGKDGALIGPTAMITLALKSSSSDSLSASEICNYISTHFTDYVAKHPKNWKKNILETVSHSPRFIKTDTKRISNWTLSNWPLRAKRAECNFRDKIRTALKNSPTGSLTRSEIIRFISVKYPECTQNPGWKTTVSAALSVNKEVFVKIRNREDRQIKSRIWSIKPQSVQKSDATVLSFSKCFEMQIRRSMRDPNNFMSLLRGELQHENDAGKDKVPAQLDLEWMTPDWIQRNDGLVPPTDLFPKPPYNMSHLLTLALKNSQDNRLWSYEVYDFIQEHFPFYKTCESNWRRAVVDVMYKNGGDFIQNKLKIAAGWGCLWKLKPEFLDEEESNSQILDDASEPRSPIEHVVLTDCPEQGEEPEPVSDRLDQMNAKGETIKMCFLGPRPDAIDGDVEFDDSLDIKQESEDESWNYEDIQIKEEVKVEEEDISPIQVTVNEDYPVEVATRRKGSHKDLDYQPVLKLQMLTIWQVAQIKQELKDADE